MYIMKFIALTFDYSIKKLEEIGRSWSKDVYKEKEHIFDYSAASYATFIFHNPDKKLVLLTDDVELLKQKLNKYKISLNNVQFIDWSNELKEYKQHKYAFKPLIELVKYFKDSSEYIIKLDNDLICKKQIDFSSLTNEVLVWKYEGVVRNGDPRWGEILVCNKVVNNIDFIRYNVGVLGLPPNFWEYYDEYYQTCEKMIDVDISQVTDVNSKIYHCCEQTAYNWIFYNHELKVIQTHDIFEHHFDNKNKCIYEAQYLLKKDENE